MITDLDRCIIELAPQVTLAFRKIPAGTFSTGSRGYYVDEEPMHRVRIERDFWMAETPVTQGQFAIWTAESEREHENHFDGHVDHPAENLNWYDAVEFCGWLTQAKRGQFPAGFVAALPTEAEWEYACRAGTQTEYYTGDGVAALAEAGWFGEDWDTGSTHAVRQRRPNDWQLYDMHGNVWEWCYDLWEEFAYRGRVDGQIDPSATVRDQDLLSGMQTEEGEAPIRVLRGGSWFNSAFGCRSAYRFRFGAGDRIGIGGFRVCLVPSPALADE